jgi:EAL domain-containing protein (putative c-di-GMP-specific phosphodiesterase class I)
VAEGVEDAATAMALRELGCAHAQGYHFGRPQPLQSAIATMNAD